MKISSSLPHTANRRCWDEGSLRGTTRLKAPQRFHFLLPDNGGRPSGIGRSIERGKPPLARDRPFSRWDGSLFSAMRAAFAHGPLGRVGDILSQVAGIVKAFRGRFRVFPRAQGTGGSAVPASRRSRFGADRPAISRRRASHPHPSLRADSARWVPPPRQPCDSAVAAQPPIPALSRHTVRHSVASLGHRLWLPPRRSHPDRDAGTPAQAKKPIDLNANTHRKTVMPDSAVVSTTCAAAKSVSPPSCCAMG